jgi:hypothetical protein
MEALAGVCNVTPKNFSDVLCDTATQCVNREQALEWKFKISQPSPLTIDYCRHCVKAGMNMLLSDGDQFLLVEATSVRAKAR